MVNFGGKIVIRRRRNIEAEILAEFETPISLFKPRRQAGPLILASPHSGRIYPKAFVANSALLATTLRQNEDAYIDEMLGFARFLEIPLLAALFPRCFVDVNRDRNELPAGWLKGTPTSPRSEMGLGVVPTIIAENLPIYKREPRASDAMERIRQLYDPYHTALSDLIQTTRASFGTALLLDVHSMPGFTQMGQRRPDIVLGDRHGTSCHQDTIARVESLFMAKGYNTVRNYPYAGGFVTSHYGQPENNVQVLQIEINRDLYLNPVTFNRKPGYARLAEDLKSICKELLPRAVNMSGNLPLAAE